MIGSLQFFIFGYISRDANTTKKRNRVRMAEIDLTPETDSRLDEIKESPTRQNQGHSLLRVTTKLSVAR